MVPPIFSVNKLLRDSVEKFYWKKKMQTETKRECRGEGEANWISFFDSVQQRLSLYFYPICISYHVLGKTRESGKTEIAPSNFKSPVDSLKEK